MVKSIICTFVVVPEQNSGRQDNSLSSPTHNYGKTTTSSTEFHETTKKMILFVFLKFFLGFFFV